MFSWSLMVWWRGFLDVQVSTLARQSPQKGEIPASTMTRGGGLKWFYSELISSLRKTATSESRESGGLRPRDQVNCSFSRSHWSRGGGYLSYRYLLSPPFGGILPGTFPGRLRVENNVVFTIDRQAAGGCQSAIRRALLSDACLPSVDVAGVEPARLGGF